MIPLKVPTSITICYINIWLYFFIYPSIIKILMDFSGWFKIMRALYDFYPLTIAWRKGFQFHNDSVKEYFLHFPLLYCMIVTNFLIVQFSFFILLLASWQILILVLSTRPAKVASRCRDLNPGSSACLAEMLPLD